MPEQYVTVAGEGEHETEVSRSRFVCALAPAATEEEARAFIARIRARHPGATHNCSAYVVGADAAVQKSDDDGEPGGTAGLPMLQMLLRREIRCAVAVVTRYFGGTKLGAGGLIRAYGGAVGQALDAVGTRVRRRYRLVTVTADHQRAGRLENDLRSGGRSVRGVTYGAQVTIELGLPEGEIDGFRAWLAESTAGTAGLTVGDEDYVEG
ncbi:putative YigZ family protein [Streptomyces sp. Amel2xB2]|uniref:YigZ family protein n=1 Tax=Streptomyces sp. Amel2xB2 TaxID=1305829 RepID=UPI000DB99F6D|nr:YigZ family protein [Streptomyces sp. Amel2xB2]RAJ57474.1 putative YigZ family protein [Streptomyces sp. Amel2xB2]